MTISKEKVVTLTYELRVDNNKGDVVETVKEEKPFVFLYGAGLMLPKFEEHLDGLKANDKFEFTLKCEDAYGLATEEAVMDLPKNIFEVEGKIEEGFIGVDMSPKSLVGQKGFCGTDLRPSGKVIINDEIYDAKSEDGFINKGTEVLVLRYETGQVYVMKTENE